jgi:hypothetical protein
MRFANAKRISREQIADVPADMLKRVRWNWSNEERGVSRGSLD